MVKTINIIALILGIVCLSPFNALWMSYLTYNMEIGNIQYPFMLATDIFMSITPLIIVGVTIIIGIVAIRAAKEGGDSKAYGIFGIISGIAGYFLLVAWLNIFLKIRWS